MYRYAGTLLLRAAVRQVPIAQWPDLDGRTPDDVMRWRDWTRQVWKQPAINEAVEVASPVLADRLRALCDGRIERPRQARKIVVSLIRYLLRAQHRATPFGLFAGVAPARFGDELSVRCGDDHQVIVRPDAAWLADVITRLESCPELLRRLPVVADSTAVVQGGNLVVSCRQSPPGGSNAPTQISVGLTGPVQTVLHAVRRPISIADLTDKLAREYPSAPAASVHALPAKLVVRRILLTGLRAPMTVTDPLHHLLRVLAAADADSIEQTAPTVRALRRVRRSLADHATAPPEAQPSIRASARTAMHALSRGTEQPIAADTRIDCDVVLPAQVAREAEAAATTLARLSPYPSGSPAWKEYHAAFLERFGSGALVPLLDLVAPGVGLGLPAGYRGSLRTLPPSRMTTRDERLLALAQHAALDGAREIVLDDRLRAHLAPPDPDGAPVSPPPHTDLRFRLQADTPDTLNQGAFTLSVTGLAAAAGITIGRFLGLLPSEARDEAMAAYANLPTLVPGALRAQVSSPPLRAGTENVARAPQVLPHIVSLAEHTSVDAGTIPLHDLAVGGDPQRLYLFSLRRRRVIEPAAITAVEPVNFTHPLVRFLCELPRARATVLAPFSWGAAHTLPFLPRVRVGRSILAPATWQLTAADMGFVGEKTHIDELTAWRQRRQIPAAVELGDGDQRLRLDLDTRTHLQLLRDHLQRTGRAVLHEAPQDETSGWLGGRAHEFTLMLASDHATPTPTTAKREPITIGRDHGQLPGASRWAYAKLYGPPDRHPEILTSFLPALWQTWDAPPEWWYVRYRDPDPHLRLRIKLDHRDDYGIVAQRVAAWTGELRRVGLVTHLQWDTYHPETGRYGGEAAMRAAETLFAADSTAAIAQMTTIGVTVPLQAVTAASLVDLAISFTGDTADGMRWLTRRIKQNIAAAPSRALRGLVTRLADPARDWTALQHACKGHDITRAWSARRKTLTAYRALLPDDTATLDSVLASLMHMHHIRAIGIDEYDERLSHRLARNAAVSWLARHHRERP